MEKKQCKTKMTTEKNFITRRMTYICDYDEDEYDKNCDKGSSLCIPCDQNCTRFHCRNPSVVALDGRRGLVKGNVHLVLCSLSKLHMNFNGEKTIEECGEMLNSLNLPK